MRFDYSKPLHASDVLVVLRDELRDEHLSRALLTAGRKFGFDVTIGTPTTKLAHAVCHFIWRCRGPFRNSVGGRALALLNKVDSVSVAFDYADRAEIWSASKQIEKLKQDSNGRLNFLYPDAREAGRFCVPVLKILDNAVCDTVRIKYKPWQLDTEPVWPKLKSAERGFLCSASRLYERHRLWFRSPADGYFAIRRDAGFAITATKTDKTEFDGSRVAWVCGYDEVTNVLEYRGMFLPSSDAVEAAILFSRVPRVKAILHSHASALFTRNVQYSDRVLVPPMSYGEPELGHAVANAIIDKVDDGFLIMDGHGEVFAGPDPLELLDSVSGLCKRAELSLGR